MTNWGTDPDVAAAVIILLLAVAVMILCYRLVKGLRYHEPEVHGGLHFHPPTLKPVPKPPFDDDDHSGDLFDAG